MNILILDIIHGGDVLAKEYLKKGHPVECVDIYRKAKQEVIEGLNEMGVPVHTTVPQGYFDLLVVPVHCPESFIEGVEYGKKRTFHEAVGELTDGRSRIEVTGAKGKTTTCYLLAHILSMDGRRIFLHTSRGQGPWKDKKHLIKRAVCIAPPYLLKIPKDYETVIAEVSLGGSGRAELTIITNIAEDYWIAAKKKKASEAKASIFSDGKNIVPWSEAGIWSRYRKGLLFYGGRVIVNGKKEIGKPLKISFDYDGARDVTLPGTYLHMTYIDSIEAVLEACHEMKVPADQVVLGLETFKGVPGRGEIERTDSGWKITERNPGVSRASVAKILSVLEEMGAIKNTLVTLENIDMTHCERIDSDQIRVMVEGKGAEFRLAGFGDEPPKKGIILELIKEGYQ
jgi:hypothetical protein